jgi:very-short-patch-repair endonuclease
MRREPTAPEKRLWRVLSRSQLGGYKFRRQSVIGAFIADFMCPQKGLVVEVDGHTHADPARDAWRDAKLNEMGFRVFRVSNSEIMHNLNGVCEGLLALLAEMPDRYERPHPNPSPEGEGLKDKQECLAVGLKEAVG